MAAVTTTTTRVACLAILAAALTACVQSDRAYLPTGQAVMQISCKMSITSMSQCYKAAGDMCGARGYTVFDWDGTPWPKPYPDPSTVDRETMLGNTQILVACNAPDPVRPAN